jgi:hypothetical protein
MMTYVNRIVVLSVLYLIIPITVLAGNLDDPGAPTTAGGGAMNTLEDIYNLMNTGTTNVPRTGTFAEPSAGPASTGHTTTEIYDRAKTSSRPAKTGQTTSYVTGDDGDLEKGVDWPGTRFTADTDTVTDNLTGLMWSRDASPEAGGSEVEQVTWSTALTYCDDMSLAGHDDWRLPNIKELQSLIDFSQYNPALPSNPFTGVQGGYWSSTTDGNNTTYAWGMDLANGTVSSGGFIKTGDHYVWPVRGGQ